MTGIFCATLCPHNASLSTASADVIVDLSDDAMSLGEPGWWRHRRNSGWWLLRRLSVAIRYWNDQWRHLLSAIYVQCCRRHNVGIYCAMLPPSPDHLLPHLSKLQTVFFNIQHPAFGITSLTLSVSLIHILVFYLYTALHMSDPHCQHHQCQPTFTPRFHSRLKTHLFFKSFPP